MKNVTKLAVLFPGISYNGDRPLLYYGRKLAEKNGYTCKVLPYVYKGDRHIRGNVQKMEEAFQTLYAQAQELLADVDYDSFDEVLFISKSVGTVIAASYAKKLRGNGILYGSGEKAKLRHILYTPLEYTFRYEPENAVGFLGTADPWCVPEDVIRIAKEQNVPMHIYERADHSLETGDVSADLKILKDVMEKTAAFICGAEGT